MNQWNRRSIEERSLFNPAFLTLLVLEAARGHESETSRPLDFPLAFLAVALGTHDQVLESLPPTIATSLFSWLRDEPLAQIQVVSRAREFAPRTREAIRLGIQVKALSLVGHGAIQADSPHPNASSRRLRGSQNLKGSFFAGRWFARAGDPGTILAAWGASV